ncbi:hypothetical protein GOP47_0005899 [Adiantum capillus-veneris]|uniref:Ankyrin repeat protein n=1 Tax=Adiantum capillus-veneris TaxID=13818 RepID=A0A9D4V2T4_ADICA|nr:hypothetical protein GOP47_0005899 [Adiantum capillus-veneris]
MNSSPLHLAVSEGHLDVVQEFVSFFRSFTSERAAEDTANSASPQSPQFLDFIERASLFDSKEWFQSLIEWVMRWGHADVLGIIMRTLPSILRLLTKDFPSSATFNLPLVLAVHNHSHLELLNRLLRQGQENSYDLQQTVFEITAGTKDKLRSVLHVAAAQCDAGSLDVMRFFLDTKGMDADLNVNTRSFLQMFTPLHVAANCGNLEVVRLLLQRSSLEDVLARDVMGRTALHYAARDGHEAVVQILLHHCRISNEINIASIADHDGLLALHMAARSGCVGVVEKLINNSRIAGTLYNSINQQSKHSFQLKSWVERVYMQMPYSGFNNLNVYHGEVYRFQLPKLIDSLFFKTRGFTPLHFAARYGHERVVIQLLKEEGIDLQAKDEQGLSAYDWMKLAVESEKVFSASCREFIAQKMLAAQGGLISDVGKVTSEKAVVQVFTSEINDEKLALEDLWRAWWKGEQPALTANIVRRLEEDCVGRVTAHSLPCAAARGHVELVKSLVNVLKT